MAIFFHQRFRGKRTIEVGASEDVAISARPLVAVSSGPGVATINLAPVTASVTENQAHDIIIERVASEDIAISVVALTTTGVGPGSTTLSLSPVDVTVTENAGIERERQVSEDIAINPIVVTTSTSVPGSTVFPLAPVSVTVTENQAHTFKRTRSVSEDQLINALDLTVTTSTPGAVTVSLSGGGVEIPTVTTNENESHTEEITRSVTETEPINPQPLTATGSVPSAATVNLGTVGVTVTENESHNVTEGGYSGSFFSSDMTVTATDCAGDACETSSNSENSPRDNDPDLAGITVEVSFSTGTITPNATGAVIIRAWNSSGDLVSSETRNLDSTDSTSTITFQEVLSSNVVEIDIRRTGTADSASTVGGGCSSNFDCTNEEITIKAPIDVNEV